MAVVALSGLEPQTVRPHLPPRSTAASSPLNAIKDPELRAAIAAAYDAWALRHAPELLQERIA